MSDELFAGLAHTPRQHFTLYFYAAVLRVAGQAARHFGSADAVGERLPFLAGYVDEIARQVASLEGASFEEAYARWCDAIDAWERSTPCRLPLVALRTAAGLDHGDVTLLAQIGLPDEDPRFGTVFDAMQGDCGERRATPGLLGADWQRDGALDARTVAHRLQALGLTEAVPGESMGLRPCAAVWDVVRGATVVPGNGWARYRPRETLPALDSLMLSPGLRAECEHLPGVLTSGAVSLLAVRGPRHNGRSTLAAAIAGAMGKGVLDVSRLDGARDPRWRSAAAIACMLDAVILTTADPSPSETHELPDLPDGMAPVFITLGVTGALGGALADRALSLRVPVPERAVREALWQKALGTAEEGLPTLRMTSGNIIRAGRLACAARGANGGANGSARAKTHALRAAVRALERPGLDTLARRVDAEGDWSHLALPAETLAELTLFLARCRQREHLGALVGEALGGLGPGVRALFKGPSGTGKTLAARTLARELCMDLYRVDLAAVVNKYIGETEKNLERVFAHAEELDVILLLDEGDALLTQRTSVQSANDRYANLETNYLLQRLESYEGILLIATNAGERIDSAFQRRMDVVIDFPLPDAAERWAIWQVHLPARHEVGMDLLHAAVQRCALSGGQIRNVALHASLLAAESRSPVRSNHFEAAIEREYRKQGAVSPMRSRNGAH